MSAPSLTPPFRCGSAEKVSRQSSAPRVGDGWISGRTFPEVSALIAQLHRRRHEAGRDGLAFDVALSARTAPARGQVADMEAAGVGHLKVQPWAGGAQPTPLADKLRALEHFAAGYF